ncbi:MAG TPA: hypothetical protein DEA08_25895 [Planctomycetes bacterium]|nr:hypothetical protein [Planctomycetota bacterium]
MNRALFALLGFFLGVAPAFAQERAPEQRGPSQRQLELAERYATAAWPKPSAAREAIHPAALKVADFALRGLRIDPRRAEATLDFAARSPQQERAQESSRPQILVQARLQRCSSAQAARTLLLAHLGAIQATLEREANLGDVAFAGRVEERRVHVAAAQGNVFWVVRALEPTVDAGPVAAALDALVRRTPPRSAAGELTLVQAVPGTQKGAGAPLPFRLEFAGGEPAAVHCEAEGASVVRTKQGYLLYADAPGALSLRVRAATKDLRQVDVRVVLEVQ